MSSTPFSPERLGDARERPAEPEFGGGPDGNEQLTAVTGVVLIVLLAALGITILRIGQLTWLHVFLGLLLIGPVALKMSSTGYRFARYYTRSTTYRRKGPPATWLRLLAPPRISSSTPVLGHLFELPQSLRARSLDRPGAVRRQSGDIGRGIALAGAVVGGLVLAIALIADFGTWTVNTASWHH